MNREITKNNEQKKNHPTKEIEINIVTDTHSKFFIRKVSSGKTVKISAIPSHTKKQVTLPEDIYTTYGVIKEGRVSVTTNEVVLEGSDTYQVCLTTIKQKQTRAYIYMGILLSVIITSQILLDEQTWLAIFSYLGLNHMLGMILVYIITVLIILLGLIIILKKNEYYKLTVK